MKHEHVTPGRCALHCVLPPYILKKLADKAKTPEHRKRLLDSIALSAHNRGSRRFAYLVGTPRGTAEIAIYDAQHAETASGAKLLWRESSGGQLTDPDAKRVADFTKATRDFYREVFNRNSVDNNGYNLNSYIHFGDGWDNAQWDGTEMDYGDGDGEDFNSFTSAIDVVGHELTHGVTQYTSDLAYNGQSGALNESFSDVMGTMVKQFAGQQAVAKADWMIGLGLFKNGDALRSMKKPGTAFADDPQPADMDHFVNTTEDSGGVHINSGIPNRAFYESCNAFDPNRNTWETIGPVWYRAFTTLPSTSSFQDAANATLMYAKQISQAHAQAVQAGWGAVKISTK
jgi:Zn-dependent metalloprotease